HTAMEWGPWVWRRRPGTPHCAQRRHGSDAAENAERGTRNAEQKEERRTPSELPLLFRVSTSAFRVGGVVMRVGVDVGGTFTDLVALGEDGTISVRKVVTTPDDPAVAMFRALDADPRPIAVLLHGTTIATNALLAPTR